MKQGLKKIRKDREDYDFLKSHKFGGVAPTLPDNFFTDAGLWIPNQDLPQPQFGGIPALPYGCTDYTQADLCADEDKELKNPMLLEAVTHANANGGADIRVALTAAKKIFGRTQYFNVRSSGIIDWFDAIRLATYSSQPEIRSVSIGIPWFPEFSQTPSSGIMPTPVFDVMDASWHNAKIAGWKTIGGSQYLVVKPWIGDQFADKGFCYMSRELCNALMNINGTGAFTLSEVPLGQVQTVSLSLLQDLVSRITNFVTSLLKSRTIPESSPIPPTQSNPDILVTDWSLPSNAYHNTRVLCDLAGLTLDEKNLICACVFQESQFKNTAVCRNKNAQGVVTSSDWGICQINDWYHIGIGKDFSTVDYVVANPDKCIQWMIAMYQHGMLKQWVSYSSGAYKQWLLPNSPMWRLAI